MIFFFKKKDFIKKKEGKIQTNSNRTLLTFDEKSQLRKHTLTTATHQESGKLRGVKLTATFCRHSSQLVLDFRLQRAETEKMMYKN